jgi:hypothetical protein
MLNSLSGKHIPRSFVFVKGKIGTKTSRRMSSPKDKKEYNLLTSPAEICYNEEPYRNGRGL